jgi:hypothetical protein
MPLTVSIIALQLLGVKYPLPLERIRTVSFRIGPRPRFPMEFAHGRS